MVIIGPEERKVIPVGYSRLPSVWNLVVDPIDLSNPPKCVHQDFHLPVKGALQCRSIQNIPYLQELIIQS